MIRDPPSTNQARLAIASIFLALGAALAAPTATAIHDAADLCSASTLCVRIVPVAFLADVVPATDAAPSADLHVAVGILRVELASEFVEVAMGAASVTAPGSGPDFSAFQQQIGRTASTSFTPSTVASTPVTLVVDAGDPGDATGELWSARYQVWNGALKLVDVPGVTCAC